MGDGHVAEIVEAADGHLGEPLAEGLDDEPLGRVLLAAVLDQLDHGTRSPSEANRPPASIGGSCLGSPTRIIFAPARSACPTIAAISCVPSIPASSITSTSPLTKAPAADSEFGCAACAP